MSFIKTICPYCGNRAEFVTGKTLYPHRRDLHARNYYSCAPCGAHVGCHPGTTKPLGRLANAELRRAKIRAHAAFDPLWQEGTMKRANAYAWLAGAMGIAKTKCHIGLFDVEECDRVVEAVKTLRKKT